MIKDSGNNHEDNGHVKKARGRKQHLPVNGRLRSSKTSMGGEVPADILIKAQHYFPSMFNSDMKMRPTLTEMVYAYTGASSGASHSFKEMYPRLESPTPEDLNERKKIGKELKLNKRSAEYFLTWIKDEMKNRGELTVEQEKRFTNYVNVIPQPTGPLR